jgi:hypothetical protein
VNDAMTKVNRMLMARSTPINELNKVAQTLGPDGKKLMGQAMLQNMYQHNF